jgi:hypothetical protein
MIAVFSRQIPVTRAVFALIAVDLHSPANPLGVIGTNGALLRPAFCPRIWHAEAFWHRRISQQHDAERAGVDRGQVKIERVRLDIFVGASALTGQMRSHRDQWSTKTITSFA